MYLYSSLVIVLSVFSAITLQNSPRKLHSVEGDVNIAFLYQNCENGSLDANRNSLIHSALWTVQRINYLELLSPLKLGLSIYQTCSELDFLETLFEIYKTDENYTLGIITTRKINKQIGKFARSLDLRIKSVKKEYESVIKASMMFLKKLGRDHEVTVMTTEEKSLEAFYGQSRRLRVCLKEFIVLQNTSFIDYNISETSTLVLFGTAFELDQILSNVRTEKLTNENTTIVLVPLDAISPNTLFDGSYVILPPRYHVIDEDFKDLTIFPTPVLFDIASPLLEYALETRNFIKSNCNDTIYKINCLRTETEIKKPFFVSDLKEMSRILNIEPLKELFFYEILYNNSNKVSSYNIFFENMTWYEENELNKTEDEFSGSICPNHLVIRKQNQEIDFKISSFGFRSESWIYAFLSLSLLGIILCIAILIFLLSSVIQRTIFEGNPVLTFLLLFSVVFLFCSVLPFSIEPTKSNTELLCTIKTLSVTLSYTAAFSLMLGRAIMLTNVNKEMGFMAHISGPVQAFLTLFIFGAQAALSLQVIGRCSVILSSVYFVYLMSYNIVILMFLLCLSPLMYKSQRNYREGKYFTVAIILVSTTWCVWLPSFVILDSCWREFVICFGLISTGGIILGAVFVPRTYLMTIAAERDKITSALPSLATGTSAVDIYRAHSQPIYDCVNVTAINAAAIARAGIVPNAPVMGLQQPDLYSCPALPEDLDFNLRCDSPTSTDKVTRF
ncbi:protein bride of sevenless [Sitophilus oryzae]|uniref:Protein bride of sevenless n=1 Tax=Sitophilus oryzae TaxID=7048 RepID=A0A6J2YEJ4_SITOR|nr:protein bride of sevenless [Sitophilus oryzae]